VAVIDSGIDADHPAVGGRVEYAAIVEEDGEITVDTQPHGDDFGHGTACAGIIRAQAPDCLLTSVKVLGPNMTGRGAVFAAGLRWAIENGMQVCNLSLGTTKRDFYAVLHELVDEAYFANIMLVTAAHNQPLLSFPSTYSSVISVASHDVRDGEVYYCNPKPPVEFGALGIDVRVAWRDGEWIIATGNSFATPHIAGLVTRMLGKHPGLNVVHVKAILRALADNVVEKP
jgi:subtilisin family serine protease